jgi:hypothetical protein
MIPIARLLVIIGVILIAAGGLIFLAARLGLPLGRLPGDIRIERGGLTCVIALGTSILLSVILTLALNLLARFLNK